MKIILTETQYGYLLEVSEESLRNEFVGANVVSEEEFETIKRTFHKMSFRVWILKSIKNNFISVDDIFDFVHYFSTFERYRKYYPIMDIRKIETLGDVERFVSISQMILSGHKDLISQNPSTIKGEIIGDDEIRELSSVGINYLGFCDDYQVFEIPQKKQDIQDVWQKYRSILGKCHSKIGGLDKFCTYKHPVSFSKYIKLGPLYIFYSVNDSLSPYQLSYDNIEFRDRTNITMLKDVNKLGEKLKFEPDRLTKLKKFTKFLIDKGLQFDNEEFKKILQ